MHPISFELDNGMRHFVVLNAFTILLHVVWLLLHSCICLLLYGIGGVFITHAYFFYHNTGAWLKSIDPRGK